VSQVAPGTEIAGYRIEALVGRGGMGEVYRATQLSLTRIVALKLIAAELARNEEFQIRFRREAQVAASLEHPHVLPVYEVGEADGRLYLSMRYVDGQNLAELLVDGPLEPARAVGIVAQLADALDAAHAHGLVHRDVKPANVLVEQHGEGDHAYLSDFGLSKLAAVSESPTQTGQLLGTVDYLAPEAIDAGTVDARSDVYSLGCVLWETLTGSVVFPRTSPMAKLWGHVHDEPPALADARPGLAPALDDVLRRALAKEPAERYPSAGDLGRAAVAAVEGRRIAEPERSVAVGEALRPLPPTPAARPRRRARSRALLAGAVVVLAVAAGVLAGWAAFGRSEPVTAAPAPPQPPAGTPPAPPATTAVEAAGATIELGAAVDVLFAIDAGEGAVFATAARNREDGIQERGLFRIDPTVDEVVGPPVWFYEELGLDLQTMTVGEGAGWVLAQTFYTGENVDEVESGVNRVDPRSGDVGDAIVLAHGFSVESLLGVTTGEGSVWAIGVASGAEPEKGPAAFLHEIDPTTSTVVQRLRVPLPGDSFDVLPGGIAAGGGSIWIPVSPVGGPGDSILLRVDPETGAAADPIDLGPTPVFECTYAGDIVWLETSDNRLLRVDPSLGQVVGTPMTYGSGELLGFAATDAEGAWALESRDGQGYLWQLDLTSGEPAGEALPVGVAPGALGVGEGAVWVGTGRGTITRIDVPPA
jgi:hypothetical protein